LLGLVIGQAEDARPNVVDPRANDLHFGREEFHDLSLGQDLSLRQRFFTLYRRDRPAADWASRADQA